MDAQTPDTSIQELQRRFDRQRAAFAAGPFPGLGARRDRVARVLALTREHESDLAAAISRDFGHRSAHETRLAEVFSSRRPPATR